MLKIKSSQKFFTEDEVSGLTGICRDHLRDLSQSRHLGSVARAAEAVGVHAQNMLFTSSDLMILAVLFPRCEH